MVNEIKQRSYIAEILIGFSLIGITAISSVVIYVDNKNAQTVFQTLVPLFGTWIGTVLAYYFSRANFVTAADTYRQASEGKSSIGEAVTTVMIDKGKIGGLIQISQGQSEADILVQARLIASLKAPITRIPVVDPSGCVRYILHESTIYKYIANSVASQGPGGFNLATATLKDLLQSDPKIKSLATAFALVPSTSSVAAAKKKMDETENCQDIFVSDTGKPTEPMLGWITDDLLASFSKI